jgi:cell division protein FtsL
VAATALAGLLVSMVIPNLLWTTSSTYDLNTRRSVAGSGGSRDKVTSDAYPFEAKDDQDRKTIRNGSLDLIVKNPRETSERIRQLAERAGGFLVTSEIFGGQDVSSATLQIRVPTNRFEEVRGEIRKLGLRVENEKIQAEDVTKQYVDQAARLRNLRAQETQYLGILKQAKTVKDTLEVSDKLNEVRGEIEQQQAEFEALSKQVETVSLSISLRAEADAKVFGLNWRPLYQLKIAARQGIDGIADYAAAMSSFLFYLPTVLLWLATILIGAPLGWRILRWAGRSLFVTRVKAA